MASGYSEFVDKAHTFACGIYKNFPGALVPDVSDAGYKKIWDRLCDEPVPPDLPGLPPPPAPPFAGGQCCSTHYNVQLKFDFTDGRPSQTFIPSSVYQGKILGLQVRKEIELGEVRNNTYLRWQDCEGEIFEDHQVREGEPRTVYASIVQVFPAYGGANNCGNPPKKFPPAPPIPPGGYTSPQITIVDNDGDTNNYIFNFSPPQKNDFPDIAFPPITVNVEGVDVNLNFDINFNFDGTVTPGVGGNGGGGLNPELVQKLDGLGGGISEIGSAVSGVVENLRFVFNPPLFFDSPKVNKEQKAIAGGGEKEDDKDGLLGIFVKLTKPSKEIIFGTPNVHFAGWITFRTQGGYVPREPIAFDEGYFPAPEGATGYALTFTKGAEGEITIYSKAAT